MKKTLLLFIFISAIPAMAQKDTAKAPVYGWKHSLAGALNLSQVSFTDWAQGGENSLAYGMLLSGNSQNDQERTNWSNTYKLAFGQSRLGSQGVRKTDDEIRLESVFKYKLQPVLGLYAAASVQTQFATGYRYAVNGIDVPISALWDPGYLTQSAGLIWTPMTEISTRIGLQARETFTSKYNQYADDPGTVEIEKTRFQGGPESVTEIKWPLAENVVLSSRIEFFAAFNHLDRVIVRNDNTLAMKVNNYLTALLSAQIWQEPDVSPRTQFKQSIALGLSYNFL